MNKLIIFLVLGACGYFAPLAAAEVPTQNTPALKIHQAWIREAPPVSSTSAGYMELENEGDTDVVLNGVSSPDFNMTMLHDVVIEDGVARMLHREQLVIPARGRLALQPGGLHIMLMGRKRPLEAGATVELTFEFKQIPAQTFSVPVKRAE